MHNSLIALLENTHHSAVASHWDEAQYSGGNNSVTVSLIFNSNFQKQKAHMEVVHTYVLLIKRFINICSYVLARQSVKL